MTTGADPVSEPSVGERATALWRAARAPLAVAALVVLGSVILAVTADQPADGELDPASTAETGSRAIATLLRDAGVEPVTTRASADVTAAGADTTVLVAFPDRLSDDQLDTVHRSGADLVLVRPEQHQLAVLAPAVTVAPDGQEVRLGDREPACELAAARAAGVVELGGGSYLSDTGTGCYPDGAGVGLVRVADGARTVTVLGSGEPLTNGHLANEGNAALAVRLLGGKPRLLWYLPAPEAAADRRSLAELVPAGWRWAPLQLAVAAVVAALWRGRRLGALVTEPLPVVVRATETTEGRARLYRRAGARGHAAECLRAAARARLAGSVGLGRAGGGTGEVDSGEDRDGTTLTEAVAARTGRSAAQVRALLYGPAPRDDQAMVELADQLDDCEREVRRS
jgi:anti-sigma-K factor RskA